MRPSNGGMELHALRRYWRRWTAIVELYARRRRGRGWLDPKQYAVLHGKLLAACRALAANGRESDRAFYLTLEDLARPWLSSSALEHADREILFDLFARCQEAGRLLRCWTWLDTVGRHAGLLCVLLLVAVAVVLLGAAGEWLWGPLLDWARDHWRMLVLAARHGDAPPWWAVAGGVVAVVGVILLFTRSARV